MLVPFEYLQNYRVVDSASLIQTDQNQVINQRLHLNNHDAFTPEYGCKE